MAKRRNEPKPTSNAPLIIMLAGAIIVIALVAWALTRSVEQPSTVPQVADQQAPPAIDTSTFTAAPPPSTTAWSTDGSAGQPAPQPTLIPPVIPPAQQQQQASADPTAAVPRMAIEDFKPKLDRGEVTVIDVRDANSYAAAHIPGALHIPMASIQTEIPNLPKNKPIVAYCT